MYTCVCVSVCVCESVCIRVCVCIQEREGGACVCMCVLEGFVRGLVRGEGVELISC